MRKGVYNGLRAISPGAIRQTLARWLAALDAASRMLFSEPEPGQPKRRQL